MFFQNTSKYHNLAADVEQALGFKGSRASKAFKLLEVFPEKNPLSNAGCHWTQTEEEAWRSKHMI